ncbi:MAG TPA: hypothetical protein VKA91_07655 [Nitrososphaeraceae archaeon]|nr:hypothetical protein [Nitrososphaeraceae archaeon]
MSAKDHFCKTKIAVTYESSHDSLIVDFEACNEPNLGTHVNHDFDELLR